MMSEEPVHRMILDSCLTELDTDEQKASELSSARLYKRGIIGRVEIRLEGSQIVGD